MSVCCVWRMNSMRMQNQEHTLVDYSWCASAANHVVAAFPIAHTHSALKASWNKGPRWHQQSSLKPAPAKTESSQARGEVVSGKGNILVDILLQLTSGIGCAGKGD